MNMYNIQAFNNLGLDDTTMFQAAIDGVGGSDVIHIPPGEYVIERTLTYRTNVNASGLKLYGPGARIISKVDGPLFDLNGSGDWTRQSGGFMYGVRFDGGTGHCIQLRANWNYKIDHCIITDFRGDGVHIDNAGDDHDASCYFVITNTQLIRNGYGMRVELQSYGGCTGFYISHCTITANRKGGLRLPVFELELTQCGIHANQGDGGLIVPVEHEGTRYGYYIHNNEFDTNYPCHVNIGTGLCVQIVRNRFITQTLGKLPLASNSVLLGQSPAPGSYVGAVQGAEIKCNVIRNTPVNLPHNVIVVGSNALGAEITNNSIVGWSTRAGKFLIDNGKKTVFKQEGL